MIRFKVRHGLFLFLMIVLSAILISSCSMKEISDTFGSCCGVSPLPIGAVGLMIVCRGWKKR